MPGFESFKRPPKADKLKEAEERESSMEDISKVEGQDIEKLKDYLFDQYLKQKLIEDFFEELEEYLDNDSIDIMRGELVKYGDAEIYSALSLPYELRKRKFENFEKAIEEGKDPADLIRDHVEVSSRYGYSIGYHTSPNDIKPDENGRWNIKGLENDHRDADLSKAYYSTKYRHLFKKKDPKFIYIIRTDPDTHATDGNWSRAGMLSVVTRVPFADVVNYVESRASDLQNKRADT